jgi:hypothetical protein
MLSFLAFDEHGPARERDLVRPHLLGAGDATYGGQVGFKSGNIRCKPEESRPATALALEADAGRAGTLTLQTCLLQQRSEPYELFEELARHRIKLFLEKAEQWGWLDPARAPEAFELFERARSTFVAGMMEANPWRSQLLHRDALALGIFASEKLAVRRAEEMLQGRFAAQGAAMALGVRVPLEKAPELMKACQSPEIDLALIPTPWTVIEASQGRHSWEQVDRWVLWARERRKRLLMGPLLDLRPGGLPSWVLPLLKDLPKFEAKLYDFVRETAIRYGPHAPSWVMAAGVNSNEVATLSAGEMMRVVRHVSVTLRQALPAARGFVEVADPFGERSPADNGAIGAIAFVRMLVSDGVKFDAVGVPLLAGDPQHGTRDLMQVAAMLDRFVSRKEMPPIYVSALGAPSSAPAEPGIGAWREPWSERAQAAWCSMAFQVAMANKKVSFVIWDRWRDEAGTGIRSSGMFAADGSPKQVAVRLLSLRRALRKPTAAAAASEPQQP